MEKPTTDGVVLDPSGASDENIALFDWESGVNDVKVCSFFHYFLPGANSLAAEKFFPMLEKAAAHKVNMLGKIEGKKGAETLSAEVVLSAVGIKSNIENLGLEEMGIAVERDKIVVDEHYQTSAKGIYAIGDIIATPALAHVASTEAIHCVEHICGLNPEPIDYSTIPSCIFTSPEVASVGMTEAQVKAQGIEYKVGKFPYTASGKATAAGERDGFVKLIFDSEEKLLGAHLVGHNVTEMIGEPTLAKTLGVTAHRIAHTIHAHPSMHEAVMEAAEDALGCSIHV